VNHALYALVKLAEESNELAARSAPAATAR